LERIIDITYKEIPKGTNESFSSKVSISLVKRNFIDLVMQRNSPLIQPRPLNGQISDVFQRGLYA
jgi:hypothetical protein